MSGFNCCVVAGLVAIGMTVLADAEAETLTATDVMQAALEHSYATRQSGQAVRAAEAQELQAKARGRPQLELSGRASRYSGLEESALGALTIPELATRYHFSATVNQPIYTGGRLRRQLEAERLDRDAAIAAQDTTAADVALDALTAYWSWSRACQAVASAQAAVERMRALYDDVSHQHAAGLATDNDRVATEVEWERARLRLATAEQSIELALAQLAFLTGAPIPSGATPQMAPAPGGDALPAESELLATAFSNRSERVTMMAEVAAAAARVQASRADRRPMVHLQAGYDYANPNPLFFPPDDAWEDYAFAGVAAGWNVWDSGLTRGRVAEAAAHLAHAALRRDQVDEVITLDVRAARIRLQEALNRYQVALRAQDSARRNLETATALWKNGLARQSDVLDAEARVADADAAAESSVADVAVGRAGLAHACGTLALAGQSP